MVNFNFSIINITFSGFSSIELFQPKLSELFSSLFLYMIFSLVIIIYVSGVIFFFFFIRSSAMHKIIYVSGVLVLPTSLV